MEQTTTIIVSGREIEITVKGDTMWLKVDGRPFVPHDAEQGPGRPFGAEQGPLAFAAPGGADGENAASESAASTQDVISFRTNPDGTVEVDAHSDSRSNSSSSAQSPSENSQTESTLGTMGVSHAVSTLSTAVATGISMLESANAFSHRNSVRMASSVQTIAGIYDATAASRRRDEGE